MKKIALFFFRQKFCGHPNFQRYSEEKEKKQKKSKKKKIETMEIKKVKRKPLRQKQEEQQAKGEVKNSGKSLSVNHRHNKICKTQYRN